MALIKNEANLVVPLSQYNLFYFPKRMSSLCFNNMFSN